MMKADFFYTTFIGRGFLKLLWQTGVFRLAAWFLHTKLSRCLIPGTIKRNRIDMSSFQGQTYDSFADFFARKREDVSFDPDPETLISPCDGLLSVYDITSDLQIPMKGSVYGLEDILPNPKLCRRFADGLCMVFRLQASDYHHFCCFDGGRILKTKYIPGQLHSVQPIALRSVPVYRLNRRWISLLETEHFGKAVQAEVGAMLVGGVSFASGDRQSIMIRGSRMGNFELAGSTILLFVNGSVRERLTFYEPYTKAMDGAEEVPVKMGIAIGALCNEQ